MAGLGKNENWHVGGKNEEKKGKRGKEPVKNASKIKIYWFFFNNM